MNIHHARPRGRRYIEPWQEGEEVLGSPARVLLAEDDRELRRLLARELREEGYLVQEAGTGFELLEHLDALTHRSQTVDLIVSDIRMPGLTGLSVVERLRNGDTWDSSQTPVILITAFGDEETHTEAKRLGVIVLDKPFDLDDFRACAVNLVSPRAT